LNQTDFLAEGCN